MHDERLSRTTNVKEAFPSQAHLNASAFNWTQLQQLDAGSWFLEVRGGRAGGQWLAALRPNTAGLSVAGEGCMNWQQQ